MCLSTVDSKPTRKYGIGYKIVELLDGKHLSWDFGPKARTIEYPIGEWVTDPNKHPISSTYGIRYPAGFHLILVVRPALREEYNGKRLNGGKFTVVIRCRFRRVVATGDDFLGNVVVARELMNLGEIGEEVRWKGVRRKPAFSLPTSHFIRGK